MRPAGTTAVVTGSFPAVAIAVAVVSGAAGMVGVYLDTAWHRTVGRDSFFIPPHVFIYCGGLGVLGAALRRVARATLGSAEDFGGPILRLRRLRMPLGFAVTALGIFVIMAGAPVDAWWHATFGKDVLIWSPPHLQLHLGAGVAAIGLLFAVAAQRGRGALASAWPWRGPILALPAAVLSLAFWGAERRRARSQRDGAWLSVAAGVAFTVVFVTMEFAWMGWAVGRPWATERVVAALPLVLVTGALSGWVGWVLGGFLRAVGSASGAVAEFGSRWRARVAAIVAIVLALVGLAATYRPQRYGPPMLVDELKLVPFSAFPYQEAIFWNVVLAEGWPFAPRIDARSEGIIDGLPVPVGPAWCAPTEAALATAVAGARFGVEVNGTPVDLAPYPLVRLRLRDGSHCAWVGVASAFQRASQNRFVYTIERPALGVPLTTRVELGVTFKDP